MAPRQGLPQPHVSAFHPTRLRGHGCEIHVVFMTLHMERGKVDLIGEPDMIRAHQPDIRGLNRDGPSMSWPKYNMTETYSCVCLSNEYFFGLH